MKAKIMKQGKNRQKAYMERKKANKAKQHANVKLTFKTPTRNAAPTPTTVNISTRAATDAKRAYWRERKQAERERLKSRPQRLRRIRETDRQRKRDQRAKQKSKQVLNKHISNTNGRIQLNTHTQKPHNFGQKKSPQTPEKFASVVAGPRLVKKRS